MQPYKLHGMELTGWDSGFKLGSIKYMGSPFNLVVGDCLQILKFLVNLEPMQLPLLILAWKEWSEAKKRVARLRLYSGNPELAGVGFMHPRGWTIMAAVIPQPQRCGVHPMTESSTTEGASSSGSLSPCTSNKV